MLGCDWLWSHTLLTSLTSGWQESMEMGGYGMVVQESRNTSQILLLPASGYILTM